jgi:L-fucose mutarotase
LGKSSIVVRCDGHGVPEIISAILKVFPLDRYVDAPVTLMELVAGDPVKTPIWDTYADIISRYDQRGQAAIRHVERFAFYEQAKSAYAIVATGEIALYANVMLQKGVIELG